MNTEFNKKLDEALNLPRLFSSPEYIRGYKDSEEGIELESGIPELDSKSGYQLEMMGGIGEVADKYPESDYLKGYRDAEYVRADRDPIEPPPESGRDWIKRRSREARQEKYFDPRSPMA